MKNGTIRLFKMLRSGVLCLALLFTSMHFSPQTVRAESETYFGDSRYKTATTIEDIHRVFPESYWSGLDALMEQHPNWTFVAFRTGLDFEDCFVPYSPDGPQSEVWPQHNLVKVYHNQTTGEFSLIYP
ncbi:MAG: hypothetical protein IKY02_02315, partial [Lachnospiraceae bacterium]|nr:hypothetical protein [Lachnospiraceae bacterium]